MNLNEYGVIFRHGVGFDLSSNTALSITFTKPSGATLTVSNPSVTAPASIGGSFSANEYFSYVFADGNVDEAGEWSVRATYTDGSKQLISDAVTFIINP
ncbi:hypothetical protein HBA54_04175 [Pelagibius litoralis]|uniref:Uncharacterized protein n=1 Tax=Pelagibius litoralis TaxID=374515 RepID=A0A967C3I1_9PROT|nr:hypothetical protein [Pelagibius litoralis]NIA67779.1 hypothetical protein [Pelagibius litoralis]